MKTEDLIEELVKDTLPVRRVPRPAAATMRWLLWSLPYVLLVTVAKLALDGSPVGLDALSRQVAFVASLLTAVCAAFAAIASMTPAFDRRVLLLPLAPLAAWLAMVGRDCVLDWSRLGSVGLAMRVDWDCFPMLVVVGALPAAAMLLILQRAVHFSPRVTLTLGGLAVGALTNSALQIFHEHDASLMILVWHIGGALLIAGLSGLVGRHLLPAPVPKVLGMVSRDGR